MESLSHLSDSLSAADKGGRHDYTPQDLTNQFKQAAAGISVLYTEAAKASKKAYSTGYASAMKDVLEFLQHGLDHRPPQHVHGSRGRSRADHNAITIERVIDYIEARQETVRSLWEEQFGGEPPVAPHQSARPTEMAHVPAQAPSAKYAAPPAPAAENASSSRPKPAVSAPRRTSPSTRSSPLQERDRKARASGNTASGHKRRRSPDVVPVVPTLVDSDMKVTEILMGENEEGMTEQGGSYGNEWAEVRGERPFKRLNRR
ncbi:hypothetical protein BT69DRAFT_1333363 [Atractiella rhizophila]|nr:hypothetical protein BT69DRAFT_1333363 [Atractiella rhizophila]